LTPGLFWCPQFAQTAKPGVAGAADSCILWPQFVQNAISTGTSAWQAMQGRVSGGVGVAVTTAVCVLSDEPQCMQKAAPGFTTPLQRGQMPGEAD